MRFAAVFATILSLGFLASAAPVANVAALAAREVQLATRDTNAFLARGVSVRCNTCGDDEDDEDENNDDDNDNSDDDNESSGIIDVIVSIHADITVSINAITDACNQDDVTVDILAPLFVTLIAHINALVTAVVKVNVDVLGLISINLNLFVTACVSVLVDLIVCLQLVLKVCADAHVHVAACVQLIIQLIIKANGCAPGSGLQIIALLKVHIQICIDIGLNLAGITL